MQHSIVDIQGLAKILFCSTATIKKTWRTYPHFFIGLGQTAKSARFDIYDVLYYLKKRDYKNGLPGQQNKKMGGRFTDYRISQAKEKGLQNKKGGEKMGEYQERKCAEPGRTADPIENFRSMFAVP